MNKENDWIDFLRKEEESFLPNPPDGLWSDISSRLGVSPNAKRRIVPLWLRLSGVAACIALLFCLGWYLRIYQRPSSSPVSKNITANTVGQSQISNTSVNQHRDICEQPLLKVSASNIIDKIATIIDVKSLSQTNSFPKSEEDTVIVPSLDDRDNSTQSIIYSTEKEKRTLTHSQSLITYEPHHKHKIQGLSLSLLVGNLVSNNSSEQFGYNVLSSVTFDDIADETYEDIEILTQGTDVQTRKHYRIPLRSGIRVSLPLSNHLLLESGLSYTRLSSTVESGSSDNYYSTDQTLHYVGIPLKLRYQIWNNKHIGVYMSGGGMIEKCVYGNSKTDFIIDGVKYSETEQEITEKQIQLSATLTAGIEAQLSPNVKLFAEPGASYYLNNHSSVDNSYKDKPINLDLSIGVRFNINK